MWWPEIALEVAGATIHAIEAFEFPNGLPGEWIAYVSWENIPGVGGTGIVSADYDPEYDPFCGIEPTDEELALMGVGLLLKMQPKERFIEELRKDVELSRLAEMKEMLDWVENLPQVTER